MEEGVVEEEEEEEGEEEEEEEEEEKGPSKPKPKGRRKRSILTGRGVTLGMLLDDGIVEPGENCLSIDYLVSVDIGGALAVSSFYCELGVVVG